MRPPCRVVQLLILSKSCGPALLRTPALVKAPALLRQEKQAAEAGQAQRVVVIKQRQAQRVVVIKHLRASKAGMPGFPFLAKFLQEGA